MCVLCLLLNVHTAIPDLSCRDQETCNALQSHQEQARHAHRETHVSGERLWHCNSFQCPAADRVGVDDMVSSLFYFLSMDLLGENIQDMLPTPPVTVPVNRLPIDHEWASFLSLGITVI